jgi:glycogen debranching enzyme
VSEVIEVNNQFYILAGSSLADDRTLVLKEGDTFGLFDHYGDIQPYGLGEQGLFHEGTRFLSLLDLRIEGKRPLFLSSIARTRNEALLIDLANPDFRDHQDNWVPRGTLHIARSKFLWNGIYYEAYELANFGMHALDFQLLLRFGADFADIFEVRGTRRVRHGRRVAPEAPQGQLAFGYEGLDGVVRSTRISLKPAATSIAEGVARFQLHLPPRTHEWIHVTVQCEIGTVVSEAQPYALASRALAEEVERLRADFAVVESTKAALGDSFERSTADLCMMLTRTPTGVYPYAGVPWFSTPFGRDGIITALQTLWINPVIARGVLAFLAATQARESDDASEADPGKIIHELRGGELAATGEIPFGRYYGSVDATPLFVILAHEYYRHTADLEFIESIWPSIHAAVEWIERYGDRDGDGFVEYAQRSADGLLHQGWKDSRDSVFHSDGRLAEPPIALAEVQGYVYLAWRSAAALNLTMGDKTRAAELERCAAALRARFDRAFWCASKGTYALALDGGKRQCEVRSSNAGHCLYTGIAAGDRAMDVVQTLMSGTSFSGWGIRTLDAGEVRYNPMSYHNGSVWPHDTAIVAQGLANYGCKQEAVQLLSALYDLSRAVRAHRLPELICGFPRVDTRGPTLYPVACSPQAWAAGSLYMALHACLGIQIDAPARCLKFEYPALPPFIRELHLQNMRVGSTVVDLSLHRHTENVGISVDRRTGPLEIVVVK